MPHVEDQRAPDLGQASIKKVKSRSFLSVATTFVVVVICALALWQLPKIQVASLRNAKGVNITDVVKAENDARATLAQIIGGFAVLIGLYFAWRNITATVENLKLANQNLELTKETTAKNLEVANQNLEVANQNLELSKEGQVAERFTQAIEQLGASDKLELRLGGIQALEQIARDYENYHWPIMEILTAHLRKNAAAHWRKIYDTDIPVINQAIVMVIRRRNWHHEKFGQQLNLNGVDLRGAHLEEAHLEGAALFDAHLERAHLNNAHLEGAHLEEAHLEDAALFDAHLEEAHLEGAHLRGTYLIGAYLIGAELARAHLDDAHLSDAKLHHTRMFGALGLTQPQVDSAEGIHVPGCRTASVCRNHGRMYHLGSPQVNITSTRRSCGLAHLDRTNRG